MDQIRILTTRSGRLIASVAVAFSIAIALTGIVNAGNLGQYFADGVYIRTGPHISDTAVGQGFYGQNICDWFTVSGDTVNSNPYWDYHTNQATSVTGYSSWEYLGIYGPPPTSC